MLFEVQIAAALSAKHLTGHALYATDITLALNPM